MRSKTLVSTNLNRCILPEFFYKRIFLRVTKKPMIAGLVCEYLHDFHGLQGTHTSGPIKKHIGSLQYLETFGHSLDDTINQHINTNG